jgi:hypothetical protein
VLAENEDDSGGHPCEAAPPSRAAAATLTPPSRAAPRTLRTKAWPPRSSVRTGHIQRISYTPLNAGFLLAPLTLHLHPFGLPI